MGTEIKQLLPYDVYQGITAIGSGVLVGRYSVGTGFIEQITLGAGLSLSGAGVLSAAGGGGGESLSATLAIGNTTGANNIIIDQTQYIQFNNNDSTGNVKLKYTNATVGAFDLQLPTHAGTLLTDLIYDTTPQLGGALDVNGNKIVSVANGNIDIEPNGTGNVLLGNFTFDADQVVGPGQDNYVLTYDDATGLISLEAATGSAYTFSTGLTDTAGTITNNLSTGIAGGQTIYGGTAASENLTIESTTNATKGIIQLAPISGGLVTIGNPTFSANQRQLRVGLSSNYIDMGTLSSGPGGTVGLWAKQTTPDGTNYLIAAGNAAGDVKVNMAVSATNAVIGLSVAGVNRFVYKPNEAYFSWTPEAKAGGALTQTYRFALPGHTAQTAGSEIIGFYIDGTTSIEHDTGAIATQRDVRITNRTHTFVAASTITDAHTVQIDGATVGGTNATITNSNAFTIASSVLTNVTNSYGLTVNAQTGGTNNYTARFLGGNVGILTSAPNSSLQVAGSVATGWRAISAADSFTSTDFTIESSGAVAYNVTLPTAVGITGRIYVLKNVSGADKTLATTGGETIDGATTRVVTATNSIMVQSNGTNWIIIG